VNQKRVVAVSAEAQTARQVAGRGRQARAWFWANQGTAGKIVRNERAEVKGRTQAGGQPKCRERWRQGNPAGGNPKKKKKSEGEAGWQAVVQRQPRQVAGRTRNQAGKAGRHQAVEVDPGRQESN